MRIFTRTPRNALDASAAALTYHLSKPLRARQRGVYAVDVGTHPPPPPFLVPSLGSARREPPHYSRPRRWQLVHPILPVFIVPKLADRSNGGPRTVPA